jgi:hypothetical protein
MGFAIGCKTTNGIFLILLLVWLVWRVLRKRIERGARSLLAFAAPALLLSAPWFLKSYLWTGNPVYPFFYGVFGGANWSAALARTYDIEQAQFGMGRSLAALLLLPWNLTFHADVFSKGIGQFASPGPFLLALLPLLVLARPLPRWCAAYLLAALGFLAIWAALTQQVRYLLPLFPALGLAAAYAGERVPFARAGRYSVYGFVALMLLLTAIRGLLYVQPMIPVALGVASPQDYLSKTFQLEPAVRWVNETLPPDAKILLLEETRGFYFDRAYMWGNPGHHTLIPWDSFDTPEKMADWLRDKGFTHVLLNFLWMRKGWGSSPWENVVLRGVRSGALKPVLEKPTFAVFEIRGGKGQGRAAH